MNSGEIRGWVTEALSRVPMPEAPVREPWVLAPSALIAPRLPRPLARVPGLLDRFGAIRLAQHEIGIDTAHPVPWKDIVEVRTLPLLDVLTIGTSGSPARGPNSWIAADVSSQSVYELTRTKA